MYLVNTITDDAAQIQSLILFDGSSLLLKLRFSSMQYAWNIENLTYGNFVINNLRITNSPNMLQQFIGQIPFGLGCLSIDNREPSLIEDFSSGNSSLYILDTDEVEEYTQLLKS